MNAIWEAVTWDIARAVGFTAYILLTLAVIVGLALSTKLQSPTCWPRLINNEMHNFLTLLLHVLVHDTMQAKAIFQQMEVVSWNLNVCSRRWPLKSSTAGSSMIFATRIPSLTRC